MAGRAMVKDLDKLVEELGWITKMDFFIDRRLGTPQLKERTPEGYGRDVSPLLPAGKLADWIRAFTFGAKYGIHSTAAKNEWRRK